MAQTALANSDQQRGMTLAHVVELTGYSLPEIALIRTTVAKDATSLQDLALFLLASKELKLNPLLKQIYWIVRDGKGGIQVGIDGFRLNAARSREYAGSEAPIFRGVISVQDGDRTIDVPERATVVVWRIVQGHKCAFTGEARWSEFYPGSKQGFMWRKMPHSQLGKCAEAQALRKGFPAEMTGMPAAPEADDDAGHVAVTEVEPAPRPTLTAADYTRIHGAEDEWDRAPDQPVVVDSKDDDGRLVTSKKDPLWAAWSAAQAQAEADGIPVDNLPLGTAADVLRASTEMLTEMVQQRRAEAAPA